jgi:AcrR family transcriptional regulator
MPFHIAASDPKPSGRLDAEAWIEAGFDALAENGVEAIRVERLAKCMGVTKGSFYWHFKDRQALLEAMLHAWRQRATLAIIERLESGNESPQTRLKHLISLTRSNQARPNRGADLEMAIRMWAKRDEKAASCIEEIDRLRLNYIQGLLTATGQFSPEHAKSRAVLVYAYMEGLASIRGSVDDTLLALCESLILTA